MKIYELMQSNNIAELVEYIKNKDIRGVSLLTVIDALVPAYFTLEELRKRGAIVAFDQIFMDSKAYLANIENASMDTEDYLTRLRQGIIELINSWKQKKLQYDELEIYLNAKALEQIEHDEYHCTLVFNVKKYLDQKIQEKFEAIYNAWTQQAIDGADNEVIENVVISNLLGQWKSRTGVNPQLILQLKKYMVKILLTRYQQRNLSEAVVNHTNQHLIKMILKSIYDKSICEHEALSKALSEGFLLLLSIGKELVIGTDVNSHYETVINELLDKWLTGRSLKAVGLSLCNFIKNSLTDVKLEGVERDEVERAMVEKLIAKFKEKRLVPSLQTELHQFLSNCVLFDLNVRFQTDEQLQVSLRKAVIEMMLDDWKENKLTKNILMVLDELLLKEFNEAIQSIEQATSILKNVAQLRSLEKQVRVLEQEIKKIPKLELDIQELNQSIKVLVLSNMHLKNQNAQLTAEIELLEAYKAQVGKKQPEVDPIAVKTFFAPVLKDDRKMQDTTEDTTPSPMPKK